MKEYGDVLVEVPNEWRHRVSPRYEARQFAEEAGGTLTDDEPETSYEVQRNSTMYHFKMYREVPE